MRKSTTLVAAVAALALTIGSPAVSAQDRGSQGKGRQGSVRQSDQRQVQPPPARGQGQGRGQVRVIPQNVPRYDTRNWNRPPTFVLPRYSTRVYQPYYTFRPRTQLTFGLSIGYPVAYPAWYDPFGRNSYFYGSPWQSYRSYYGGIAFDIRPLDTAIFVDGDYVGRAGDFGPFNAPLTLYSGRHRIELEARGCAPAVFNVNVFAREVIPYRGSLRCAY